MSKKECKILSPVGSSDILPAAVYSGADYVYLSGKRYGARELADNFSYAELKEAVDFCHEYNVNVFVTVNISILESEIIDVVDYIFYLYSHGVDGVIIQDIGLASIIHELIPDLELHASTQMTIYDYSYVKWLCNNGFCNANISREVPLNRIRNITEKLNEFNYDINIEVFGHGALCYCYSGQCLMSSFLGGRSGNRGLCAQPCRMRYVLEDSYHAPLNNGGYLISTKDLCTYNHVQDFIDSGVNCIKIEGRMKDRDYVSSTTYCYKKAVEGNYNSDDFLLLNLTFNRGLTSGYINNNPPDKVISRRHSGNQGYPIGFVSKVNDRKVTIKFGDRRYPTKIINGDGIKFEFDGDTSGMYVSKIISQSKNMITILLNKQIHVYEGSMVYITYSKYLHNKVTSIINEKHVHKTVLDLKIYINNERQMEIKCKSDDFKKEVTYVSEKTFEYAKNKPLTKKTINKQLRKTGDTNFKINNIVYENFYDNLFMPLSNINNIRRELLELIDSTLLKSHVPENKELQIVKKNIETFKNKHYTKEEKERTEDKIQWNIYINKIEQAEIIKNYDYIDTVYYDGSFNYSSIHDYCKGIYDELIKLHEIISNKEIVWILPRLLLDEDISHISEILLKMELEDIEIKVQTDNIGVANEIDTTCYGSNLNIYNNYSIKKLNSTPGFKQLTLSNELSYNDIKKLNRSDCKLEYVLFGNVQLMISKDNLKDITLSDMSNKYYLVDKRNKNFRVFVDCYNHTHIFDYRLIDLTNNLDKLYNTAISSMSIDARFFNTEDTEKIIEYIQNKKNGNNKIINLSENKEFYQCNFEKGVYVKK